MAIELKKAKITLKNNSFTAKAVTLPDTPEEVLEKAIEEANANQKRILADGAELDGPSFEGQAGPESEPVDEGPKTWPELVINMEISGYEEFDQIKQEYFNDPANYETLSVSDEDETSERTFEHVTLDSFQCVRNEFVYNHDENGNLLEKEEKYFADFYFRGLEKEE